MTNGSNTWGVSFSHISWFQRLLQTHGNVRNVTRSRDLLFELDRVRQRDQLKALCCNEYTMGITSVHRALSEFGRIDVIYIGGGWCGYTEEAKRYCLESKIGLYVTDEMSGALWLDDYWAYHRKDRDGNPVYYFRAA